MQNNESQPVQIYWWSRRNITITEQKIKTQTMIYIYIYGERNFALKRKMQLLEELLMMYKQPLNAENTAERT
jgi:hypothetical protein